MKLSKTKRGKYVNAQETQSIIDFIRSHTAHIAQVCRLVTRNSTSIFKTPILFFELPLVEFSN
jgi:hypothetical protein